MQGTPTPRIARGGKAVYGAPLGILMLEARSSIDGCHALDSSGPQVAKFFPRWHRPAGGAG